MNFFYSFTETLLHSLWQSALLLLLCFFLSLSNKSLHPLYKRNLFYSIIGLQIILSIGTFLYCFNNFNTILWLSANTISILNNQQQQWLQNNSIFIFYIYLVIIFVRLCSMWVQWLKFKQFYVRALIKPSASLKIFTQVKAFHFGIKRSINVWYSKNVETPVTFGCLKPIILLPFSLINNITTEEAECIILHELAHVKNNDYLLNLLLIVVETLYFFNPFIKIITEKIKFEREKNCDIQVLNFGYDPILYAQTLLKIAKNNNSHSPFPLAAAKNTTQLLHRIQFFTNKRKLNFTSISPIFISLIFLIVSALCLLPFGKTITVKNEIITAFKKAGKLPSTILAYNPDNETGNNAIENKVLIHTEEPLIEKPQEEAITDGATDEITIEENTTVPDNLFSTVSYTESADSTKEVTINIETQQGKVTQVYKLLLKGGKWIVQPQWMIVEKNADSNTVKMRDSLYNKMDSIQ